MKYEKKKIAVRTAVRSKATVTPKQTKQFKK